MPAGVKHLPDHLLVAALVELFGNLRNCYLHHGSMRSGPVVSLFKQVCVGRMRGSPMNRISQRNNIKIKSGLCVCSMTARVRRANADAPVSRDSAGDAHTCWSDLSLENDLTSPFMGLEGPHSAPPETKLGKDIVRSCLCVCLCCVWGVKVRVKVPLTSGPLGSLLVAGEERRSTGSGYAGRAGHMDNEAVMRRQDEKKTKGMSE